MVKVLCPGSFDPLTLGHLDVIRRCSKAFDRVIVAVGVNENKKGFLSYEKRLEYINDAICDLPNVSAVLYTGLTVDFAKEQGIDLIVKGVRNSEDFAYENEMTVVNRDISLKKYGSEIETLYMYSAPEYIHTSSTLVRELVSMNLPVEKYVHNEMLLYKLIK